MKKKHLLWVGDAGVSTGFERGTRYTLKALAEEYVLAVLGINCYGEPKVTKTVGDQFEVLHPPYPMYPANLGGDWLGVNRLASLIDNLEIDVVVLQTDTWFIPRYMEAASKARRPHALVGAVAVDGKNCQGWQLNGLSLAIFWTTFGEQEAREGGYVGPSAVIPLGVDRSIYKPLPDPKSELRNALFEPMPDSPIKLPLPAGAFVVGNINRNQPRKRFDLLLRYFSNWIHGRMIRDAYLVVSSCPTGESAYDLDQLARYYKIRDRVILLEPPAGNGLPEQVLNCLYNTFDVMMTTTQGEGMGLTTLEGMAAGIPQIVPDWAALGDWTGDGVAKVECTSTSVTPNANVIGGVMDETQAVDELTDLYVFDSKRKQLAARGLAKACEPQFDWSNIGALFAKTLRTRLL